MADIAYEACFFRDACRRGLIRRRVRHLEKQTFDLMVRLSDHHILIIEAKAQQGYKTKQLEILKRARELMLSGARFKTKGISLIGLYSSKYRIRPSTKAYFDASLTWQELSKAYPRRSEIFTHADSIYGDSRTKVTHRCQSI